MQVLKDGPTQDITKCIEKLIELGADVNATYPNGEFAGENFVVAAARENCQDIFDLAINHHANVGVVSKSGKSAFYYAALNQNAEMLSHLIELSQNVENDLKRRYENNKSLMHVLFNRFSNDSLSDKVDTVLECIKILFNNGLDLDLTDDMLNTPLHLAAAFKNTKPIVEFLMLNGCDPQDTNKKERTVYLVAHRNIIPFISQLSMQEDVRKAIRERKENKRGAEGTKQADTLSFGSKSDEKAATLARKRRTQLLMMTRRGGTLRTPISGKQKASTKGAQSKAALKKSEARPWGGSKETAMFQRQTRIQIRQMKNEILNELQELKDALNEVEKQLNENLGYSNSEITTDNEINVSEIHENNQNSMAEEDQISMNFDENVENQETKEITVNESGDENQQNQDANEENYEDENQQDQDENEPVSIDIDLVEEDHEDGNHIDQSNDDEENPVEVNDENNHNEEENQNDDQIENIEDHHDEEEALNDIHQENSDEIPTEETIEDHQNEEEASNEADQSHEKENEQNEENHEDEQVNADEEDHQVEIDVDVDDEENTEN